MSISTDLISSGPPRKSAGNWSASVDRALRVVFDRPVLDVGVEDARRWRLRFETPHDVFVDGLAAQQLPDESHLALERMVRAAHAVGGDLHGEDGVPSGVRGRRTFPHRKLAHAGLAHRGVRDRRDRDGVLDPLRRKLQERSGAARDPDPNVVHVVPSVGPEARGVAERDRDLVSDGDRGDQLPRGAPVPLGERNERGDGVGGVQRLLGEVRVVEVETPDRDAVREPGGLGVRPVGRSPQGGAAGLPVGGGIPSGRRGRRFVEAGQRDSEAVEQPALDLVDRLGGQGVGRDRRRVAGEEAAVSIGHGHLRSRRGAAFESTLPRPSGDRSGEPREDG